MEKMLLAVDGHAPVNGKFDVTEIETLRGSLVLQTEVKRRATTE